MEVYKIFVMSLTLIMASVFSVCAGFERISAQPRKVDVESYECTNILTGAKNIELELNEIKVRFPFNDSEVAEYSNATDCAKFEHNVLQETAGEEDITYDESWILVEDLANCSLSINGLKLCKGSTIKDVYEGFGKPDRYIGDEDFDLSIYYFIDGSIEFFSDAATEEVISVDVHCLKERG